jgi:hypothetical protein
LENDWGVWKKKKKKKKKMIMEMGFDGCKK